MLEDLLPIGIDNLLRETAAVKTAGYRLVTLTCTALDENHFDILYHFDRGLALKHLRLEVAAETPVPSISMTRSFISAAFIRGALSNSILSEGIST